MGTIQTKKSQGERKSLTFTSKKGGNYGGRLWGTSQEKGEVVLVGERQEGEGGDLLSGRSLQMCARGELSHRKK